MLFRSNHAEAKAPRHITTLGLSPYSFQAVLISEAYIFQAQI